MPSSKGKPTDSKLREQVKKEVQNETNKDGSGKGQWSAWKSAKLSKEYENRGGDYENEPGSKNEPMKGTPVEKSGKKRQREVKQEAADDQTEEDEGDDGENEKPKNKGKKDRKQPQIKEEAPKKKLKRTPGQNKRRREKTTAREEREPQEGWRKSARLREAETKTGGRKKNQTTDYLHF